MTQAMASKKQQEKKQTEGTKVEPSPVSVPRETGSIALELIDSCLREVALLPSSQHPLPSKRRAETATPTQPKASKAPTFKPKNMPATLSFSHDLLENVVLKALEKITSLTQEQQRVLAASCATHMEGQVNAFRNETYCTGFSAAQRAREPPLNLAVRL